MDRITIYDQIRLLEGVKSCLDEIRFSVDTYLFTEPQNILDELRLSGFTQEVADNYEQRFLAPDLRDVEECRGRIILPTIEYIEKQIEGLKRILAQAEGF